MQDEIGAAIGRGELVLADGGGERTVRFDLRALGALLTS
jgi:hypothetical protein